MRRVLRVLSKPVAFPNTQPGPQWNIGFACLGFMIYRKRATDAVGSTGRRNTLIF